MGAVRRIAFIACCACFLLCCVLGGVAHAEITPDDEEYLQDFVQHVVEREMQVYTREQLRPAIDSLRVNYDGRFDYVLGTLDDVQSRLDDVDSQLQSGEAKVVVLDETQWATLRDCWHWGKMAVAVALFLMLSVTLFVCVLIGQRLWDAFARGWRK